jgi:hypothetical protein
MKSVLLHHDGRSPFRASPPGISPGQSDHPCRPTPAAAVPCQTRTARGAVGQSQKKLRSDWADHSAAPHSTYATTQPRQSRSQCTLLSTARAQQADTEHSTATPITVTAASERETAAASRVRGHSRRLPEPAHVPTKPKKRQVITVMG